MTCGCVAVTGGTGFVGSHVISTLIEGGWSVRMLVRPGRGHAVPENVHVVSGDLSDHDALKRLTEGADVLVHAAGAIKAASRQDFMATNRDGSRRLAEIVAASNHRMRVVVLSSMAARVTGLSDYADSKAAGELVFAEHGLTDVVILRPSAVYGPGDKETGAWLKAARGPILPVPDCPKARICVIHVADVAAAVTALCADQGPRGTFELTDPRTDGYGWDELAETARAAGGARCRIVKIPAAAITAAGWLGGMISRVTGCAIMLTSGKAREILHPDWSSRADRQPPTSLWSPRWGLGDGMAQTLATL